MTTPKRLSLAEMQELEPGAMHPVVITPDVARGLLELNTHNRSVRKTAVRGYARDMTEGRWAMTNTGIVVGAGGTIDDGQHRLLACAESGVEIETFIMVGAPPSLRGKIDVGIRRTTADTLGLAGFAYRHEIATVARMLIQYDEQTVAAREYISTSRIEEYVDAHTEEMLEAGSRASQYRSLAKPQVGGTAWVLTSRVDAQAANEFFASMIEYDMKGAGDPRAALRRRLNNMRMNKTSVAPWRELGLFLRTWNAWREGRPLGSLALDTFPRYPKLV